MGGLEPSAISLELVIEMFGIEDVESFVMALATIRDFQEGARN